MNDATKRRPSVPVARAVAVAVIAAATLTQPARAQDAPPAPAELSLPDAIGLAIENNPNFLQQQNDIGVGRSQVRAAYGGLLPSASANTTFGYSAPGELRFQNFVLGEEPESYYSSYNLGMTMQLSGSTLLQPSVDRAQLRATRRRVAGVQANLVSFVTERYLAALNAQEQIAQAEREVTRTREHVRLAEARLEVGAGTPLDVRRAEVQQGQAQVSLLQARNLYATSILQLGEQLGVPLDPAVELTSDFELFEPGWEVDELVDMALANNPNLLAARSTVDAAKTSVTAARTGYLPSLSLSLSTRGYVSQYGDIDPLVERELAQARGSFAACQDDNLVRSRVGLPPNPCLNPDAPGVGQGIRDRLAAQNSGFPFDYIDQPWQATAQVSLPVFTGFDRQLQVDRAKAAAADARYQVRAEELRLRQEVAAAVLNLNTAYQTVLLQQQVRGAAEEELRLAQERFRFGAASSVEVTDAQTSLAEAERDLINGVYDFHRSLAALEALVGRQLR